MPPQSRGHRRLGSHSQSVPNLAKLNEVHPLAGGQFLPTPRKTPTPDRSHASPLRHDLLAPPANDESTDDEESHDSDDVTLSTRPSSTPKRIEPRRVSTQPPPQRPFYSQASRSQSYLGPQPAAFAPPFYNRPPTPLPPSPSLTSLLRPPFSAQPSRPDTPDSSDTEATAGTGATNAASDAGNLAVSARIANGPVPRASPKVPTYEYYGFVLYLGSSIAFLMYLLWSYLPAPFLHQLGIYYYPNRWWSLAVPSWLTILVIYIFVALASYNTGYLTLPMTSLETFVDEKGEVAVVDGHGKIIRRDRERERERGGARFKARHPQHHHQHQQHRHASGHGSNTTATNDLVWRDVWNEGTDAVLDIPLGGVCEILYGADRDSDPDEYYEYDSDEGATCFDTRDKASVLVERGESELSA